MIIPSLYDKKRVKIASTQQPVLLLLYDKGI